MDGGGGEEAGVGCVEKRTDETKVCETERRWRESRRSRIQDCADKTAGWAEVRFLCGRGARSSLAGLSQWQQGPGAGT